MMATARFSFSRAFRHWTPRAFLALALLGPASRAQNPPRSPGPPSPAERARQPGPWDQDIHVYRVPARGAPELLTTFARGGVATAARLGDGRLAIAHQCFPENNEADFDKVAVHFSSDEGRTWTAAQVIRLRGLPPGLRFPFDPTLVPLPDARVRMYFTSRQLGPGDAVPAIYSATSENAVDYTFEPGRRFGLERRGVIDCAVVWHRGEFHLFAPDNGVGHPADPGRDPRPPAERAQENTGYHAVSKDGLTFTRLADVHLEGRRRWLGDAKSDGKTITFYGTGEGGIWTATSADGTHWIPGPAIGGARAADPGTVALRDGALLVAGTGPPRPGTASARRRSMTSPPPPNPPRQQVGITFPRSIWEQRAPGDVGLDAARLDAFAANVGGDGVVIKDGYLVKSWGEVATHQWWASASKPVLSTLLLCAVQEGRLPGVDAPVKQAGWALSPKDAPMTFRQLANMTSGYACAEAPGAAWGYNDFAIQLYARSLEKIFGQSLADAFQQRFAILQFEDGAFFGHRDNLGVVASPRDFARLGWLWLNRGHWAGREVVAERLFSEHVRPQVPADLPRAVTKDRKPDDYLGLGSYGGGTNQTPHGPGVYGFNFWFNAPTTAGERVWPAAPPDVYQANGLWNRDTLTVFPGLRMVVAVRAAHPGKFEPGQPDSTYDRNMRLLVEAAARGARPANLTVFPGREWEIAKPESQGVDAAKLQAAVAWLEKTVGKDGARELVVVRHGRMIWHGDDIDKVHGVWSFTKSFTSTALGLLIDDGKCTLDTKAKDVLPAMAAVYPEVTLRHFATMTSGYRAMGDEPQGTYAHGPSVTPFMPGPEPLFTPPGSRFAYWDSAMNQFANVLTRIAGESLEELLQRRIAEPIGMNRGKWDWGDWKQVDGLVVNGGSGNKSGALKISAREAARFGLLFLNRGRWGERRLLSARWVDEATRVQVPANVPHGFSVRASSGPGEYGFNWWVNGLKPDGARKFPDAPPRTYCAAGHNNNLCFVIPEWDMVIVRLGLDGSAGDKVWNDFLAQVGAAVAPGAWAGKGE